MATSRKDFAIPKDPATLPLGRLFIRFTAGVLVVALAILAAASAASATYSDQLRRYPYLTDVVSNKVSASANERDPNSGNNSSTASTKVNK